MSSYENKKDHSYSLKDSYSKCTCIEVFQNNKILSGKFLFNFFLPILLIKKVNK